MKICPYCGEEYHDETLRCASDGETLLDDASRPWPAPKLVAVPDKNSKFLIYPEYQWSARDAWKCLGMIVVFWIFFYFSSRALGLKLPIFRAWRRTGFGYLCCSLIYNAVFLVVAAYFARTETLSSFCKGFGLDRKPSDYAAFGIVCALLIRVAGHFVLSHHWSHGVSVYAISAYRHTQSFERIFYLGSLIVVAPIFEEAVNRGFVFKAFRESYSLSISTVLLIAWTAATHWSQYTQSAVALFGLSLLTIVQCYVREKSDSLWDCVLCHFAYNASILFIPGVLT